MDSIENTPHFMTSFPGWPPLPFLLSSSLCLTSFPSCLLFLVFLSPSLPMTWAMRAPLKALSLSVTSVTGPTSRLILDIQLDLILAIFFMLFFMKRTEHKKTRVQVTIFKPMN